MADIVSSTRAANGGGYAVAFYGTGDGGFPGINQGNGADWFGPGNPLKPVAPEQVRGRSHDLRPAINMVPQPRAYEPISFEMLEGLAKAYDLLATIIETRKDQMVATKWSAAPTDGTKATPEQQTRIDKINKFFKRPQPGVPYSKWLRKWLHDTLVTDAATIYPRFTKGGDLYELRIFAGKTIKPLEDDWGEPPAPPMPAYQQTLHGLPAVFYRQPTGKRDGQDLVYAPRNIRPGHLYGFSPVEQVITIVNIAIRREVWQLKFFTEGSVPDMLLGTPPEWTPQQVRDFQDWWDSVQLTAAGGRRGVRFVPGGVGKESVNTKETELFGAAEEWMARVICFAFSISPQSFTKQTNRATAETQKEMSDEEGIQPLKQYVKETIDQIIELYFDSPDLGLKYDEEEEIDQQTLSAIVIKEVQAGLKSIDEGRRKLGDDPLGGDFATPMAYTSMNGYEPIAVDAQIAQQKAKIAGGIMADPTKPDPIKVAMAAAGGLGPPGVDGQGSGKGKPPSKGKGGKAGAVAAKKLFDAMPMAKLVRLHQALGADLAKYSEDQPRDEHGRWTQSGGFSSSQENRDLYDALSAHLASVGDGRPPLPGANRLSLTELGNQIGEDRAHDDRQQAEDEVNFKEPELPPGPEDSHGSPDRGEDGKPITNEDRANAEALVAQMRAWSSAHGYSHKGVATGEPGESGSAGPGAGDLIEVDGLLFELVKYSPDQPRDNDGRFASGGGDLAPLSTDELVEHAENWIGGDWESYQSNARGIINGTFSPTDYGVEVEARLLAQIDGSKTLDYPLYRGLYPTENADPRDYKVGDTFSESLATWTSHEDLADKFAQGHYAGGPYDAIGQGVVMKVTGSEMKGIPITRLLVDQGEEDVLSPIARAADEHWTSGEYRITEIRTNTFGHPEMDVVRIGPPVAKDLKKFSEDQPRDDHGRWTSGGGGDPVSADFNQACYDMAAKFAPDFEASATAPNTFEALVQSYQETGKVTVWNGASDKTIFGDDEKANYAFRAWHDSQHLALAAKFTPEGEHQVAERQVAQVRDAYGNTPAADRMVGLIRAEIDGQVGYFQEHHDFPVNQRAFDQAWLADPDKAIHADFSKLLKEDRSWGRLRDLGDTTPPSAAALALAHTMSQVAKYSPDQNRDERGRFSSGGGATFASPNLADHETVDAAVQALASDRQTAFEAAAADIDHQLGISGQESAVVGAWSDGAENSTMLQTRGASLDQLRLSAAMKGALGDQKAVLVFRSDPKGQALLYSGEAKGSVADIHQALMDHGVEFHTLAPTAGGAKVYIADLDGSAGEGIKSYAEAADVHFTAYKGEGEFIGGDTREEGQRAYREVIDHSGFISPHGSDASAIWGSVRDRWATRIAALKVLKYSPDQERDERGRWTSGGGVAALQVTPTHDPVREAIVRAKDQANREEVSDILTKAGMKLVAVKDMDQEMRNVADVQTRGDYRGPDDRASLEAQDRLTPEEANTPIESAWQQAQVGQAQGIADAVQTLKDQGLDHLVAEVQKTPVTLAPLQPGSTAYAETIDDGKKRAFLFNSTIMQGDMEIVSVADGEKRQLVSSVVAAEALDSIGGHDGRLAADKAWAETSALHEYGHLLDATVGHAFAQNAQDIVKTGYENGLFADKHEGGAWVRDHISAYAATSKFEMVAELFAARVKGLDIPSQFKGLADSMWETAKSGAEPHLHWSDDVER